ncbi:MAG: hypothetical protein RIC57_03455 [Balneola sp.]
MKILLKNGISINVGDENNLALLIYGTSGGEKTMKLISNANNARSFATEHVIWLRKPTERELQIIKAGMIQSHKSKEIHLYRD